MHPILKEMAKLNQMNHPQKGLYFCPLLIHLDQIMESFLIRSPEYTHTEACTSIHTFFIFCIFQKKKKTPEFEASPCPVGLCRKKSFQTNLMFEHPSLNNVPH